MSRRSAFAASFVFHCLIIFILLVVRLPTAQISQMTGIDLRQHSVLVYTPPRLAASFLPHPVRAVVSARSTASEPGHPTAASGSFYTGKIEIGALDHLTYATDSRLRNGNYGEVVLGSLSGRAHGSRQLDQIGTVGPTNVFSSFGHARNHFSMPSQQVGDEPARLLSAPVPSYTDEARRLNVTGKVLVEVKLTAFGEVP